MVGEEWLVYESNFRLVSFALCLLVCSFFESRRPMRDDLTNKGRRWLTNYALVVVDTLVLRLSFPILAIGVARHWDGGLFNQWNSPLVVKILCAILVLDLIIYFQHRVFHSVPLLWRLHRVHHSDVKIDSSTALRFHPVEIVLSMGIKIGAVLALGIAPEAILIFEILLSSSAIFNHSNWNLGPWDERLRPLIVTPNMHRIHHSVRVEETNSNYGFCLSLWDRLFKTHTTNPKDSHQHMMIGLENHRSPEDQTLVALLLNPFR